MECSFKDIVNIENDFVDITETILHSEYSTKSDSVSIFKLF